MCRFNRTDDPPPRSILPDSDGFYQKSKEALSREQLALLWLIRPSTLYNSGTFRSTVTDTSIRPRADAIRNVKSVGVINR